VASAGTIVFLPGFGGSQLVARQPPGGIIWAGKVALALGFWRYLALSPDGASPAPSATPLTVTQALSPYYDQVQQLFFPAARAAGYTPIMMPYDWRQSVFRAGADVTSAVLALGLAADSLTLIGHSMGGLVALRVWTILGQIGQQGVVHRVITLGTPLLGTWAAAQLLSGGGDVADQLIAVTSTVGSVLPAPGTAATPESVAALAATWPSAYELLPQPSGEVPPDPLAAALYSADNWQSPASPSQAWLDHAAGPYRTWLLGLASTPPYAVLTTVAGSGRPTLSGWGSLGQIGQSLSLLQDGDGDGSVLTSSALALASVRVQTSSLHQSIAEDLSASGQLLDLVTEPRPFPPPPPIPPPPVVDLAGFAGPLLRGPPLAITGIAGVDP
jgi:pimeloyl-ACP methyl ester carboxylesterase